MGGTDSILSGVIATGGQRVDPARAPAPRLSRERVKALLGEGRITLAGKAVAQASLKPDAGTPFTIAVPEAAPAEAAAQDIPLAIVFEDAHLVVVDKPAGLVVHPAAGNLDGTLVNALLHHCAGQLSGIGGGARPGVRPRDDKDNPGPVGAAQRAVRRSLDRAGLLRDHGGRAPAAGRHRARQHRPL